MITLQRLADSGHANQGLQTTLQDPARRRQWPHRLEQVGYVTVRNPHAKDGLWKVEGRRQVVYARRELTPAQRLGEAQKIGAGKYLW